MFYVDKGIGDKHFHMSLVGMRIVIVFTEDNLIGIQNLHNLNSFQGFIIRT